MAKEKRVEQMISKEMTAEESRAFRASLFKPEKKKFSEKEKREAFRIFWAAARKKYGKTKEIEEIIWLHLKSTKMDEPEKFEDGIAHFGLKKNR